MEFHHIYGFASACLKFQQDALSIHEDTKMAGGKYESFQKLQVGIFKLLMLGAQLPLGLQQDVSIKLLPFFWEVVSVAIYELSLKEIPLGL